MKLYTKAFPAVLLLGVLLFISGRGAATAATIDQFVVGGGGGKQEAGNYTIHATIGQPIAVLDASGSSEVCSGFWCTVDPSTDFPWSMFLPAIISPGD